VAVCGALHLDPHCSSHSHQSRLQLNWQTRDRTEMKSRR
jgi:hypothetical protein